LSRFPCRLPQQDVLSLRRSLGEALPTYTFKLSDDSGGVEDDTGVSLLNNEVARHYACAVVRELMNCRELRTRHWRLDVYEGTRQVFQIPFASLDHTLDHLLPQYREMVELICEQRRSLNDVMHDVSITRREAQALVARSRGKPYLAANRGQKIVRD
jgi:hypothetical protein